MPGVFVTTQTRTGPSAPNLSPSGQVFMAGMAERGSTAAPVLIRSLADFESEFGGRTTYSHLYDNIAVFFEEGGSQAWVIRVVGSTATKGTLTLVDRQTLGESTIKVDAVSPGAWSDDIDIVVEDLSGNVTQVSVVVGTTTTETFTGTTVEELVAAMQGSSYVTVTNMGSDGVAPANKPATGTFHVSAGTDDRAGVNSAAYTAALDLFGPNLGDGAVAIPGVGSSVHAALLAHAKKYNRRIALLSDSETASTSTLSTAADNLNSEFGGLFAPWVQIATPVGLKYTSPEGYVAAVRNRAHTEAGPWRVPAGQIATARSVVGLKYDYTRAQGDTLDAAKVNVIRYVNNTIRLYGWRSLSDDTANYAMLNSRDVLNNVVVQAEARLEQFVFQTIDGKGQLLASVGGTLVGVLESMYIAGGLYSKVGPNGALIDRGYLVDTGPNVNTLETLSNNEVRALVSVRVSPSAAMISVTVVKVGLLSNL